MSEMTTEILEQNLSKVVLVRLKGGKSLRGRLKGFDQHLNLVLEETEDTTAVENQKKLGLIIVRGDNVVLIFLLRLGDCRGKRNSIDGQAPGQNSPY